MKEQELTWLKYDASAHAAHTMKKNRQRGIKLIFKGTLEDLDEARIYRESFGELTPAQRLEEGWKMVEHVWELKGRSLDELRFNRTIAVIKRP